MSTKKIFIAGKNQFAVNSPKHLISIGFEKENLLSITNQNDNGIDTRQHTFKKYSLENDFIISNLGNI